MNLCDMDFPEGEVLVAEELPFEVALDSGCVEHVCDDIDAPGYPVEPSVGRRRGANFIVGNGDKVPNRCQMALRLQTEDEDGQINAAASTFQVAKVTRPLMSVSKICDGGMTATFDRHKAVVRDERGKIVCVFRRQGGLYVCKMKLRPFQRPGR